MQFKANDISEIKTSMACKDYAHGYPEKDETEDAFLTKCLLTRFHRHFGCIIPQLYWSDPVAASGIAICTFQYEIEVPKVPPNRE